MVGPCCRAALIFFLLQTSALAQSSWKPLMIGATNLQLAPGAANFFTANAAAIAAANFPGNIAITGTTTTITNLGFGQWIAMDGSRNMQIGVSPFSGNGLMTINPGYQLSLNFSGGGVVFWSGGGSFFAGGAQSCTGSQAIMNPLGFNIFGTNSSSYCEVLDIMPNDCGVPFWNNELVITGQSNRYNLTVDTSAGIAARVLWQNFTNITGKAAFTADCGDREIACDPTTSSCQIILPSLGPFALNQFDTWAFEQAWTHGISGISIGGNMQDGVPRQANLCYYIKNLGSNTANTLKVCSADHCFFWGQNPATTNLQISNLTEVKLETVDATNILVSYTSMAPPAGGGALPANIVTNGFAGTFTATNGLASLRSNLVSPTFVTLTSGVNWTNPLNCNIEVYVDGNGCDSGASIGKNGSAIPIFGPGTDFEITLHLQKGEYITITAGYMPTVSYSPY